MKKTYSFVVIALLITTMVACKKHKDDNPPQDDLISTWELESLATSWVPFTKYEPGNGNLLIFTIDSFAFIKDNQVMQQGSWTSAPDNTVEENTCMQNLKDM